MLRAKNLFIKAFIFAGPNFCWFLFFREHMSRDSILSLFLVLLIEKTPFTAPMS